MGNPHDVTMALEEELGNYCGAPAVVVVNSCTNAIQLALMWEKWNRGALNVTIPQRTYVGVAHAVINAGHRLHFRDEQWVGAYYLDCTPIWDCARRFTGGMYQRGQMQCVSFHSTKICGATQGGAILLDNMEAARWLRRARFDGRTENVHPTQDHFEQPAMHCYISPTDAALIRWKLSTLPWVNADLPTDRYPDLSMHRWFISPLRAMSRARRQGVDET